MNEKSGTYVPAASTTFHWKRIPFKERGLKAQNGVAQKLFRIIDEKQTNVAHNPDVTDKNQFLELVDAVGPHICVLKTHIDLITNFDWDLIEKLRVYAKKHNFLIFEDRKFADIGYISKMQFTKGIYRIAEWADMVNAHMLTGPTIIDGLKEGAAERECGLILLPRMSAAENFITPEYSEKVLSAAQKNADFVMGLITRERLLDDSFIHFCPGVKLQEGKDHLGQTYLTPQKVMNDGVDVIIVGRGVYQAENPEEEIKRYKNASWNAYQAALSI